MSLPKYVGIVGANGSGKSTFCTHLESKGYHVISLSQIIRDYVSNMGLKQERHTLIRVANQLKEEKGLNFLAQQCFQHVQNKQLDYVVFDSIRHPSEIHFLRSKSVIILGLTVSVESRYQRIVRRNSETDQVSLAVFKDQDQQELSGKSSGQFIQESLDFCDGIIENTGNLSTFYQRIDNALENIKIGSK